MTALDNAAAADPLAIYHRAAAKATDYDGKSAVWLLLAALTFRDALAAGSVEVPGVRLPHPSVFDASHIKAVMDHLIAKAGATPAEERKALAPFVGNVERVGAIKQDFANKRNRATRDVLPAVACARLSAHHGVDADYHMDKGQCAVPAMWLLPASTQLAPADVQALLPTNPTTLYVLPTDRSARRAVAYMTADGYAAFQRDHVRWGASDRDAKAEPQAKDYAAITPVGVNVTAVRDSYKALMEVAAAERKAAEAAKVAAEAAKSAAAASAIVDASKAAGVAADVVAAAEAAAETEAEKAKAAAEAAEAAQRAATTSTPPVVQRSPGGAVGGNNRMGRNLTIADACDFLAQAAMGDDCKRTFAPSVMECWQHLANAMWRNPNLAHAFLIERDEVAAEAAKAAAESKAS